MSIETSKPSQRKKGGVRRLTGVELDAVWDEIHAMFRNGLGWKPANPAAKVTPCQSDPSPAGSIP